jgi:hypothetical protein
MFVALLQRPDLRAMVKNIPPTGQAGDTELENSPVPNYLRCHPTSKIIPIIIR